MRTLSIADIHGLDRTKLIGLVSFLLLPAFSPFQDDGPFLAHKIYIKNTVNMLREAKKQNKVTTVWLAHSSRSNVADAKLATLLVSFEVFKRSPQPLKAGIVATAVFRRFLEFSMYSQRCISAGSMVACSACDLFRPTASPYLCTCTLAKPKRSNHS